MWAAQVDRLVEDVTRWTGNDTRTLLFADSELLTTGREDPVLADVPNDGLTVAGNHAWLTKQLHKTRI